MKVNKPRNEAEALSVSRHALFSDFKSWGFGLEETHVQYPDRLARLILVMSLALYWAVSTGIWDHVNNPTPAQKKTGNVSPQSSHEDSSLGSRAASAAP